MLEASIEIAQEQSVPAGRCDRGGLRICGAVDEEVARRIRAQVEGFGGRARVERRVHLAEDHERLVIERARRVGVCLHRRTRGADDEGAIEALGDLVLAARDQAGLVEVGARGTGRERIDLRGARRDAGQVRNHRLAVEVDRGGGGRQQVVQADGHRVAARGDQDRAWNRDGSAGRGRKAPDGRRAARQWQRAARGLEVAGDRGPDRRAGARGDRSGRRDDRRRGGWPQHALDGGQRC